MIRKTAGILSASTLLVSLVAAQTPAKPDPVFDAMQAELQRSLTLSLQQLEKPYFVSYTIDGGHAWSATASMGALLSSNSAPFRYPSLQLRVGDYNFDNSNFVGGGRGASYALSGFPLDDDKGVVRQYLWLETDSAYKGALQTIARKRSALRSVTVTEQLPDFAPAKPTVLLRDRPLTTFDDKNWIERTKRVSAVFDAYPNLRASVAEYSALTAIHRYVNSEGTEIRIPQDEAQFQIRATAQAPDGMLMRDSSLFYTGDLMKMPAEADLTAAAKTVADQLENMVKAPVGDASYSGPILFEGVASAQLLAEVLGSNLHINRKPTGVQGAGNPTELEGRRGVRIMPEMFSVVDDPTLPLFGHTEVDDEGIPSLPVTLVDKGVLKDFLRTRTPVRGYTESNGRSLIGGNPAPTNLIVKATETSSVADLKKKMIDLCQQRGLSYAIVIKKLDFPSTAASDEVRRIAAGAGGRPVALPLYIYKLYLDGHEEMIRGVKLRSVNARSLKDILAAGDDTTTLNYLENGANFAQINGSGYTTGVSVQAPSIVIDDLELVRMEDELPRLPVAPSPMLSENTAPGSAAKPVQR